MGAGEEAVEDEVGEKEVGKGPHTWFDKLTMTDKERRNEK